MSLADQIVGVTITRQTVFPSRAGFGIPLLLAYHTRTANMLDQYTSTDAMLDDNFSTTEPAYRMAVAAFSQNPRPTKVCIGRRTSGPIMIVKLLPILTTEGYVYTFAYVDPSGVETAISYTVLAASTPLIIGTALKTAIDALAGSSAAVDGVTGEVTITAAAAGAYFDLKDLPPLDILEVLNTTLNATIVEQYNAVKAVDATTWFGVCIDSAAPAEAAALAVQIETEKKIACFEVSDSECADVGVTTDIMSDFKAAGYVNSFPIFSQNRIRSYRSVAWMAKGLASGAQKPGGTTWAGLTLGGITVDSLLSDGQALVMNDLVGGGKRGNVYVPIAGLNQVQNGILPDGEFVDIIVGTYWLFARLQETVLGTLYNAANSGGKIPYTDAGAAIIRGNVLSVLGTGIDNQFLAADPSPTCTVPKVATVAPATRAARQLPDVNFSATLAGAINTVVISGVLSV